MGQPVIKWIALSLPLLIGAFSAFAQCPDPSDLNITATLYTQENGLSTNVLVNIGKDNTGFRYFLGVDGRWLRYDGFNFIAAENTTDNQNANFERTLFTGFEYTDGTTGGFTKQYFNRVPYKSTRDKNGKVFTWGIEGNQLRWADLSGYKTKLFSLPEELRGNVPNFSPDGAMCWVTSNKKVFRFDLSSGRFQNVQMQVGPHAEFSKYLPLSVISTSDGNTFLLQRNNLLKYNKKTNVFEVFTPLLNALREHPLPGMIMKQYLFFSESNNIFNEINLKNASAARFDLTDYCEEKNEAAVQITCMANYHDYLFIGTSNAGLFIFNRCTRTMQRFRYYLDSVNGDLSKAVSWLAVDENNIVWMQTAAGLVKLEINNQGIKTFHPASAVPGGICNDCNNVRGIYNRDKNTLLIATLSGIYSFDLVTGKFSDTFSPVDGQAVWDDRPVAAVTGDGKGSVFIGDWINEGILLLNNEKKKLVNILPRNTPGVQYDFLRCLYYDSRNVLWAGTSRGFFRITNLDEFERNNFTGKINVTDHLPGIFVDDSHKGWDCFAITGDANNNIFIGTVAGLLVYNYKTNSAQKYVHIPGNTRSLSNNEVRSLYVDGNDIWIGTNRGGLNRFEISTKTFTAYTSSNGLPNNSIYTILGDQQGYLWLGTNAGLCRFNKRDHSVRTYTPKDGIQNFEFNTNAVAKTGTGMFCFGGTNGFNIFHPDSMKGAAAASPVVITRFKIFDKKYTINSSVLHLPHDSNNVTFDFAAPDYLRGNENQYSYMLEGADKDWINAGNRGYTSYTNLEPGEYTFRVRAANYTGLWNDPVNPVKFLIHKAWYNTWLFRITILLLIVTGIAVLYRYPLRQIQKLHAVRNRIATDLHDEIGSTLSSISLSSTVIQHKLNGDNPEVKKLLQQVSSNTDDMMEALSDIVWAINSRNDRFDNVVNRMRAFAVERLEPLSVAVKFSTAKELIDINLDMAQRRNLYLIFKEAVNNIAKYSHCKNVLVEIKREGSNTYVLEIRDDGKGFDLATVNDQSLSGNGLINMKKRAEELDGELKIDSVPGEGVKLNLRFNI